MTRNDYLEIRRLILKHFGNDVVSMADLKERWLRACKKLYPRNKDSGNSDEFIEMDKAYKACLRRPYLGIRPLGRVVSEGGDAWFSSQFCNTLIDGFSHEAKKEAVNFVYGMLINDGVIKEDDSWWVEMKAEDGKLSPGCICYKGPKLRILFYNSETKGIEVFLCPKCGALG